MSDDAIVRSAPSAIVTAADVRAQIVAARERTRKQLEAIEATVGKYGRWKVAVRKHPFVTIGGAFVIGFVLANIFARREHSSSTSTGTTRRRRT